MHHESSLTNGRAPIHVVLPAYKATRTIPDVVKEMPVGAISNPTAVPGGISVVTLRAKREIGRERSTVLNLRQAFFPFQGTLNPAAPTPLLTRNERRVTCSMCFPSRWQLVGGL